MSHVYVVRVCRVHVQVAIVRGWRAVIECFHG